MPSTLFSGFFQSCSQVKLDHSREQPTSMASLWPLQVHVTEVPLKPTSRKVIRNSSMKPNVSVKDVVHFGAQCLFSQYNICLCLSWSTFMTQKLRLTPLPYFFSLC